MRKFVRGTLINLCAYNRKSAVKAEQEKFQEVIKTDGGINDMKKQCLLIASVVCVLLSVGCGNSAKLSSVAKELDVQKVELMEIKELETQQETIQKFDEKEYEYYLTKEELLTDIEQGIIFRIDTAFQKPMCPIVTGGTGLFMYMRTM